MDSLGLAGTSVAVIHKNEIKFKKSKVISSAPKKDTKLDEAIEDSDSYEEYKENINNITIIKCTITINSNRIGTRFG